MGMRRAHVRGQGLPHSLIQGTDKEGTQEHKKPARNDKNLLFGRGNFKGLD